MFLIDSHAQSFLLRWSVDHLPQALLAHRFSYNITWGAIKKEVERSNFFIEVRRILRRLWLALVISFFMFLDDDRSLVPRGWQIPGYEWDDLLVLIHSRNPRRKTPKKPAQKTEDGRHFRRR